MITIYPNEPCVIPVTYSSNPLLPYSKDYVDVQDAVMCFKTAPDKPENQFFAKYYKDGSGTGAQSGEVLIDSNSHTFSMVKLETDFVPVSSKGYNLFLGVKLAGLSQFIWLRVANSPHVIVEHDGIVSF